MKNALAVFEKDLQHFLEDPRPGLNHELLNKLLKNFQNNSFGKKQNIDEDDLFHTLARWKLGFLFLKDSKTKVKKAYIQERKQEARNLYRVYELYFEIGNVSYIGFNEIMLATNASVIEFKEKDQIPNYLRDNQSPKEKLANALTGGPIASSNIQEKKAYIKITCKGYMEGSVSKLFQEQIDYLSQILFVGEYARIFKQERSYETNSSRPSNVLIYDTKTAQKITFLIRPEISELLHQIKTPVDMVKRPTIKNRGLLAALASGDDLERAFINSIQEQLTDFLNRPISDPEVQKTKTAMLWAFESRITNNEAMKFVQICIALEAIFGNAAEQQKAALIAEKCAFYVAPSESERGKIAKILKQAYRIRNDIVHGASTKLGKADYKIFGETQRILGLSIRKEIDRIKDLVQ